MNKELNVQVSTLIKASKADVWDALVNPETIKKYMFGTKVVSNWKKGGKIIWNGVWNGKPYQDHGVILDVEPEKLLRYSHYSPLSGLPDNPLNYHTLIYELSDSDDSQVLVSLSQDNNEGKKDAEHSKIMWQKMLEDLKELLEK